MRWKVVQAIIVLPGLALVFIPILLVHLASDTRFAHRFSAPGDLTFWAGVAVGCLGFTLAVWTVALFFKHGNGTPAPWNPPTCFVVRGPYRHVRNPMIIGAILMLVAESFILQSLPIASWAVVFFAGNAVYFPLNEERRLEDRFGESYRVYKVNVPRWIPRFKGWENGESLSA